MNREIHVFADWEGLGAVRRVGLLRVTAVRGKETFAFEYDEDWLASGSSWPLDPDLNLFSGPQYLSDDHRPNFGMFLDSSPDRWGRMLMQRREALQARHENRQPRRLAESDYLLGVHDAQRVGGLRFKENLEGPFLGDEAGMTAPPWTRLRELEQASWMVQAEDSIDDPSYTTWLRLLMAPGSSLGGARPKAGVCDENGRLWIAKFPARNDDRDHAAWEMLAHRLAVRVGINVPEARIERFAGKQHTFMTRRFDRIVDSNVQSRRHFASAMTMLGYRNGTDHSEGASYLEFVEILMRHGAKVDADLAELWRRIVFSICIHNTDDHLRNHGFCLDPHGWTLSPAYDINPDPLGIALSLNISESDNSLSLDLALEVAPLFRLSNDFAAKTIDQIRDAVSGWRTIAESLGISKAEQESMSPAFTRV